MKEDFDLLQQLLDGAVKGGAFTRAIDVCRMQDAIENLKKIVHNGLQESTESFTGPPK